MFRYQTGRLIPILGLIFLFLSRLPLHAQETTAPAPATPQTINPYHGLQDQKQLAGQTLIPGLDTSILLEFEGQWFKQGDVDFSDLIFSTFQFAVAIQPVEGLSGRAVMLWEQGETEPVELDEGIVQYGDTDTIPWWIRGGRRYLPFGSYFTHFISDPFTLTLGETRATTLSAGYRWQAFSIEAGGFNGNLDSNQEDSRDHVDNGFAAFTWTPTDTFECGLSVLSDLGESLALREGLYYEAQQYGEAVGLATYASGSYGRFHVDLELVGALDDIDLQGTIITYDENDEPVGSTYHRSFRPMAWNSEIGVRLTDIMDWSFKLEGSDDLAGLPRTRFGTAINRKQGEHGVIRMEYLFGDHETDPDSQTISLQLGITL